ncbi:MAG: hypothetical protein GW942_00830 [Candidatus Pacebacteria bacterium]|nr:hypothetical protein [Candidatus Paceibacterota bacterium]
MIFKLKPTSLIIFSLFLLAFFSTGFLNSVHATCTNIITINYPAGCETVCLPGEEGCIECSSYEGCIGPDGQPPANYDGYCYETSCACPDGTVINYLGSCNEVVSQSCGNEICESNENCLSCSQDCGSCAAQTCGDNFCTGFESCLTCSEDCGVCAVENGSWWQARGGLVGSNAAEGLAIESNIPINTCQLPDCDPSLMSTDLTGLRDSVGYVLTLGGSLKVNGGVTSGSSNVFSVGTGQSRYYEYFDFFFRETDFGLQPTDDFISSSNDARKPSYSEDDVEYYHNGDLHISSPWFIHSGEQYVIFIEGDLYLADEDGLSDQLVQVDQGGFLAFVVSGNMYIDESIGNSDLNDTTANIEGVYIVNGVIEVQSRGRAGGGDDRFIGAGTFVGWSGVSLNRDFDDGAGRDIENLDKPTEQFIYRPDFMINLPDVLKSSPTLWQQTQ